MAISVFPAPVTSSINANAITAESANTMYSASVTLDPAIYTVTCASATTTNIEFYSGVATLVTSSVTASGTVAVNLSSNVDRIRLWTNTGSNVVVTITKTAAALTNNFSGTLDTITTVGSSTYTGTSTSGYGYVLVVAGGGGGGKSTGGGSGGGGAGSTGSKLVVLTGSMQAVVGAAGTAGTVGAGGTGGASTFANISTNGGVGGGSPSGGGAGGAAGTGGTHNVAGANGGAGGGGVSGGSGGSPSNTYTFIANPIGTGGAGSGGGAGSVGTGYGAGGGGSYSSSNGAAGTQGVIYVLKY